MKRRIISLMLALTLVLTALPASAQSLFGDLMKQKPVTEKAPSYAVLMETTPTSVTTLDDGSLQHFFRGVTAENFDAFGVYLAEKEYALANAEYVGETALQADVVKESISFHVLYSWADEKLTVTYPKGLEVEQPKIPDPFEGYTRVEFGEKILARMSSSDSKIDGYASVEKVDIDHLLVANVPVTNYSKSYTEDEATSYCIINYENISQRASFPCVYNVTLHYVNAINHYSYESMYYSLTPNFSINAAGGKIDYKWSYGENDVLPFETKSFAHAFKLHEPVYKSTDGFVALTFTVSGHDKPFVLYLRNPNE